MPREARKKISLRGLSDFDLDCVAAAVEALRNNRGCITPAENFIQEILLTASIRPLEPSDVEQDFQSFKDSFDDAVETTRKFNRDYPVYVEMKRAVELAEYLEKQAKDVRSGKISLSRQQVRAEPEPLTEKAPEPASSSASHNKNLFQVTSQSGVYNRPFIGHEAGPFAS